jgi:NitT/TauT family transport system substrate-binding protein
MTPVRISTLSYNYFNLPLWAAKRQGIFEAEGLDVELEVFETIDEVYERLRDGHTQFSRGTTEHVVIDREQGGDQEVVGGNLNKLAFSLIGAKHVQTIADLRGRTIGVSSIEAGSSSLVMEILAAHGLEYPRDYALSACGPIMARWEKLQSGEIDAGLQGVPLNHIALDAGYSDLGDMRRLFPDFQFSSLNVDGRWARENHATAVAFLRAWIRAHRWVFANKAASSELAHAESGVELGYADRAWDEYVGGLIFPADGAISVPAVQKLMDVSALIRALPNRGAMRAETYINTSYFDAAAAEIDASPPGP